MDTEKNLDQPAVFSLGLGGPLYHFYLWTGLAKRPLLFLKRRIIVLCLIAWLPLFILTLLNGTAFTNVKMPFIHDIEAHTRFLISLALLIFAEVVAQERLQVIVQKFLDGNIIASADRKKFNAAIASAMKWTNSIIVEPILLLLVLIIGHWVSRKFFPFGPSTWYGTKINDVITLSPAGFWFAFISLPLFQFLVLRWYYRLAIWYRFLWQVSRLPLQLNSLHPDRCGGIGFLANSVFAYEPLLLAHSFLLTGLIFNRIWNAGASLLQFYGETISILVFLIILPLTPLIFFMFPLSKTKREGTFAYSDLASHYVDKFSKKWINAEAENEDNLLGSSDIQSLADLSNSFNVSENMRVLPFGRSSIIAIIVLTALPLLPLLFTIMPLNKILSQAIGIIF